MSIDIEPNQPTSLGVRLSVASFPERVKLAWPLIVGALFVMALALGSLVQAERAADARQEALASLADSLPDNETVQKLKADVDKLAALVPPTALQPTRSCQTDINKETGKPTETCVDAPSGATLTLGRIKSTVADLEQSASDSRRAIERLSVSMTDTSGEAFADDGTTFPSNDDRRLMFRAVIGMLMALTIGCFFAVLWSSNARVVTYAIDALKIFGGFYVGLCGSVFGLSK